MSVAGFKLLHLFTVTFGTSNEQVGQHATSGDSHRQLAQLSLWLIVVSKVLWIVGSGPQGV